VDVLLVVDMQEGLLRGAPKHDLLAVVERINRLAVRVRRRGGSVGFVQHAGPVGDDFEPLTPGWHLLATIKTEPCDRIVSKTLNDAFFKTSLLVQYCEPLKLASAFGMRPLVAHCHLGLGKLSRRTGNGEQALEHLSIATAIYRDMDMRFWLEKAEAEMKGLA